MGEEKVETEERRLHATEAAAEDERHRITTEKQTVMERLLRSKRLICRTIGAFDW